ncbi:MAG: formimidoylglutamate deiminase [Acidobacteria bacterium]|nr:formimidoylglutamate deiminase [Acidobacteriota bacterium]
MPEEIIEADLTFTGEGFEPGVQVAVGADGRIAAAGRLGRTPTRRLEGQALLPGFVNVHSHAFQVGLRGRGETFPSGAGDFWSWRREMYSLVEALDPDGFHMLSLLAFREMRAAGITTVGEFHYLHHGKGEDFALDEVVLDAAAEAGIRLVLLQTFYAMGGIGKPLAGAQERFAVRSAEAYWKQFDRLAPGLDPDLQSLGVAVHSVRAASLDDVAAIHREARRRRLVFHMHVEEQPKEVEECVAAHGAPPMRLVLDRLKIDSAFTAVHGTHTAGEDLDRFAAAGGNLCVCPLTEANLGDGIPDLPRFRAAGGRISLGTDGNARISMLEEMRWLEYTQRLACRARGILRGEKGSVALPLLRAATADGARALGVEVGAIEPGRWADFVAVDLGPPLYRNLTQDDLPVALVFGCSEQAISATCVAGAWVSHRP